MSGNKALFKSMLEAKEEVGLLLQNSSVSMKTFPPPESADYDYLK
jgi:hypothetical protein